MTTIRPEECSSPAAAEWQAALLVDALLAAPTAPEGVPQEFVDLWYRQVVTVRDVRGREVRGRVVGFSPDWANLEILPNQAGAPKLLVPLSEASSDPAKGRVWTKLCLAERKLSAEEARLQELLALPVGAARDKRVALAEANVRQHRYVLRDERKRVAKRVAENKGGAR